MDIAVTKALALLETLASNPKPVRLTHLAVSLGLSKSGTHRLLQTLQQAGYVHQPKGDTRYAATLRLWQIGVRVFHRLDVVAAAQPAMRRLANHTGATIYLSQLDEKEITYLDRLVGSHLVAQTEVGNRAPVHCTATGKALLAWQDSAVIEHVVGHALHAFTRQTITNAVELRSNLARVRADGFAVQCAEWHPREYAIAAPVFDRGGNIVAAIGLSETCVPNLHAAICAVAPAVMEAGRAVSHVLAAP